MFCEFLLTMLKYRLKNCISVYILFDIGGMNMTYTYKTKGTCSTLIELELDGNIVHNVKFTGGCNGNLQAIPKLVEGLTVEHVEEKIGVSTAVCAPSCGDQLARACREAYEASRQSN